MYRRSSVFWLLMSLAISLAVSLAAPVAVPAEASAEAQQAGEPRQPLDVMLVVDNSCSMFPANQRVPGCDVWGNDPSFLRITGASLFIARMGFAQANAADYQVGVISLGDNPPELVSPLRPLSESRDALARAINSPAPRLATQIVPALEMAYRELKNSPNRRPGNLPAVVLLTDGAPYPEQGQSNADIQRLVEANADVPLFVILLQNPDQPIPGYDRYVAFWQDMQLHHNYVRSHPVKGTAEIERTYDEIVARLQNTVARPPIALAPGQTLEVFISKYVQRLVVSVTRERGRPPADVQIRDPHGAVVAGGDQDVQRFQGADNPVDVIAIGPGRLDQGGRDATWTITSNEQVYIHLDMEGAYQIQFVQPDVSVTSVPGQYLINRRQSPAQPLTVRFKLVAGLGGQAGSVVTDPQPISGRVTNPDGSSAALPVPPDLRPDAQGVYTLTYDLASGYPGAQDHPGRYILSFEAGRTDDPGGGTFPIARADLLVDAGRGASISAVAPATLSCDGAANITVTAADLDAAQEGTARVSAFGGGQEIQLTPGEGGTFAASLQPLCQAIQPTLTCSTSIETPLRFRLLSTNADGSAAEPSEQTATLRVQALPCTPTPVPTATLTPTPPPTPTPAPTPIPDRDGDGMNDLTDRCPDSAQWSILPFWAGCTPSLAMQVVGGLTGLGLLAFLALYVAPLALVMTVQPPPAGYVQVFRNGKAEGAYKSLKSLGQAARSHSVTIGSEGMLKVAGLEPVELRVERRGENAVVSKGRNGPQLFLIRDVASTYTAGNGNIVLKFAADPKRLGR